MNQRITRFSKFLFVLIVALSANTRSLAQSNAPLFSMPLACQPGETCFIQNYVDHDPSAAVKDYACAGATYDGHKGTDFRLLSTRAIEDEVSVLAAAAGVVSGLRDGMRDRLISNASDASIVNRECGNGVVIDHGQGWQTQYCHMRQNSVSVVKGERVARGQHIGDVGYSGFAQFAHLHITVRHNGLVVDPFFSDTQGVICNEKIGYANGLWTETMAEAFAYERGTLLQSGFSMAPVQPALLENGETPLAPEKTSAQAVVFYARFINLEQGDIIAIDIVGPFGEIVSNLSSPLDRGKAHYVAFAGKNRPEGNWPPGQYTGIVQLIRNGASLLQHTQEIGLN